MQHGQQSSPHCDRDKQGMNGRLACRSRDTGYVSKVFDYFRMQSGMGTDVLHSSPFEGSLWSPSRTSIRQRSCEDRVHNEASPFGMKPCPMRTVLDPSEYFTEIVQSRTSA